MSNLCSVVQQCHDLHAENISLQLPNALRMRCICEPIDGLVLACDTVVGRSINRVLGTSDFLPYSPQLNSSSRKGTSRPGTKARGQTKGHKNHLLFLELVCDSEL